MTNYQTELSAWQWFMSLVVIALTVLVSLFMCPCVEKFHKHCRKNEYTATDLDTYNSILIEKHISALSQGNKQDKRKIGNLLLTNDIVRGKVAWYGDIIKDFFTFVRLQHPFFSMFYGNDLHVISKKDRRLIFILNVALQLGNLSFASWFFFSQTTNSNDDSDDTKDTTDTKDDSIGGHFAVGVVSIFRILFSILLALIGLICNVTLYIAASCQCVEFSKYDCVRCCCHKIFGCCCKFTFFWIIIGYGFGMSYFYFSTIYNASEIHRTSNTNEKEASGVVAVFFVSYVIALYQTYIIFYTFIDVLIFYPNWKKQTGQSGYLLLEPSLKKMKNKIQTYYDYKFNPYKKLEDEKEEEKQSSHVSQRSIDLEKNNVDDNGNTFDTNDNKRPHLELFIDVNERYLNKRAYDWQIELKIKSEQPAKKENGCDKCKKCCQSFCRLFYCTICFLICCPFWFLVICVQCMSKKEEKPKGDIIDEYGNLIGKNDKEFAITYYEFQLYEKNGSLHGLRPRTYTRVAKEINAEMDIFSAKKIIPLKNNTNQYKESLLETQ